MKEDLYSTLGCFVVKENGDYYLTDKLGSLDGRFGGRKYARSFTLLLVGSDEVLQMAEDAIKSERDAYLASKDYNAARVMAKGRVKKLHGLFPCFEAVLVCRDDRVISRSKLHAADQLQ